MSLRRLQQKLRDSKSDVGFGNDIEAAFMAQAPAPKREPAYTFEEPSADFSALLEEVKQASTPLYQSMRRLNRYQLHAIFSPKKSILLSAMVGSGKTTVLTHKVLYLHFVQQVPLDKMVVLTFTNKAAQEIRDRILHFYAQQNIPPTGTMRYFGTFHSVAREIIRQHPQLGALGFKTSFTIMDSDERIEFLARLMAEHRLDVKYLTKLEQRIKSYHELGHTRYGNMKKEDDLAQLLNLAVEQKKAANVMDFDDLIRYAKQLLIADYQPAPEWIIIDEFQDCNLEQVELIECLRNPSNGVFAVGDPNQSIYQWRGSSSSIFNDFIARNGSTMMQLPMNYRTSGQLLDAAAYLLGDNQNLQAVRPEGKKLRVVRHFDDNQEAFYLARTFREQHQKGTPWNEMALLFRTRQQITIFETIFEKEQIPFQTISKRTLRDQPALLWFYNLLRAGLNPDCTEAIFHLFTSKPYGILDFKKSLIVRFAKFRQAEPQHNALEAFIAFMERYHPQHNAFIGLAQRVLSLPSLLNKSGDGRTPDLLQLLQPEAFLNPTSIHFGEVKKELQQAVTFLSAFAGRNNWGTPAEIYRAAIDQVTLEGGFGREMNASRKGNGVQLLTIHTCKGLEFDHVWLSGANTGLIPLDQKRAGAGHLKEEKRLLFVALTRARNHMEISWHAQPGAWNAQPERSYLLNAIPDPLIETIAPESPSDEPKTVPSSPADEQLKFAVAQKVSHAKYGEGKVIQSTKEAVVVDFGPYGEKSFAPAWAPLSGT